ncbi:hypothetical protein TTHERM_00084990 (macronuclear) [Tetrahymena thermophila SB210]|uniref:Uncharacterized protein n=1 Tax=Tetrahymena thermophila (strain SB210) TaxID=312017 RepID=Q236U9_TETTS|nr:hypothetical protein TTHERM_00084990 [Tetrahymena thermophila SB210]EAR92401.2 hypothetical protein TTHERM_00084990 [Tetrahymena thermophila SB210]|eukprot:XP_001012646.2 hypothetical protein TTHERM_00084990 [Tetrahymena thermophila SB210]
MIFSNIPRSPSNQISTSIQNQAGINFQSQVQHTQIPQQNKITPIMSTNKNTLTKEAPKIFTNIQTPYQSGSLHNGQRYSATQINLAATSSIQQNQLSQVNHVFFMSPQPSEKRIHSQEPARNSQNVIKKSNNNNRIFTTPDIQLYQPLSPPLHLQQNIFLDQQQTLNTQEDKNPKPLIQSIVFQPSQKAENLQNNQITNENQNEFQQIYPFKPNYESIIEVGGSQNKGNLYADEKSQNTQQQALQEDQYAALAKKVITEYKLELQKFIDENAEVIIGDQTENQRKLNEIQELIANSKTDVFNKINKFCQEKLEAITYEQTIIQKQIQEFQQTLKVKVEEQYLNQMGKQMNENISKLIETKWNESFSQVQKQIEECQNSFQILDGKQDKAFIEVGQFLTKLKTDIEKVFFEGQAYFKANLDAFGLNLSEKINTADVKSVFIEMNQGFYDQILPNLDSLKVRTDAISGSIKAMEEEQTKKIEQLEQQLSGYLSSLANGVEKLQDTQRRTDQAAVSFQNATSCLQQYKNKLDMLESIVRNLVMTSKNNQYSSEAQMQNKVDKLVEALSKIQENFKLLKEKYEKESAEWKKQINNNSTLNDSKVNSTIANNLSSQSIASFNSQLIQLTNQNKQLLESLRFKEQMIQEQKMLIDNFEKKTQTQSQQLVALIKELKQIKQESKQRQNVIQEANNSMFSSIQSNNGNNHSIADSLQQDIMSNIQVLNPKHQTSQQTPFDFNQLEDYQEEFDDDCDNIDDDDEVYDQELSLNGKCQTEEYQNQREIQSYFKKLRTEQSSHPNQQKTLHKYEQDIFFYPHENQNNDLMIQTCEVNLRDLKTLSGQESYRQNKQSLLQTQQANLFAKKPLAGFRKQLRPRRTVQKRCNTESNIENQLPQAFIKSPTSNTVISINNNCKDPTYSNSSIYNLKTEGSQSTHQTSNKQLTSQTIIQQNSQNCFSQPLKNINTTSYNQIPKLESSNHTSQQFQTQSNSQSLNSSCAVNDLVHLIKRRLLYNNTLKEQKEQKLKVKIEENRKLKDDYGKFIYDKNGQALIFSEEQLEYLEQEAQIIEIINKNK